MTEESTTNPGILTSLVVRNDHEEALDPGPAPIASNGGSGCARSAFSAFADVTELRQAQESLVAQVRELTRSNSELEQSTLILSDHLRDSLLSLSGCAQSLADENKRLSENGNDAIRCIQDGVRRMGRLITDLRGAVASNRRARNPI